MYNKKENPKSIILIISILLILINVNIINLIFFINESSLNNKISLEESPLEEFSSKKNIAEYDFPTGSEETYLGENWIRTNLFTSGGGETGCCFLDNNILVISRNRGFGDCDELDMYFYYPNGSTISFVHYANTAEGEDEWYGSYAITNGQRFGAPLNRLIISNGYYCDGDPSNPINTYGVSTNWHYNASYEHGNIYVWSFFPLIGDGVPLTDDYDKQDIVTSSGVTYAVSYGNNPSFHSLHIGKNNGTTYSDDLGIGASWPSVGGGTNGNPVIFAWMRDGGGVGILYQPEGEEEDTKSPILLSAENKTVELGSVGNSISWTWADEHPSSYKIKLEENIIDQGSWSSGTPIDLSVSASESGIKNYLCIVNDTTGNTNQSVIQYKVEDTIAPYLQSSSGDDNLEYGISSYQLSWIWEDEAPDKYNITHNGDPIQNGDWTSGNPITYDLVDFSKGSHTFICNVNDTSGLTNFDMIIIEISDTTAPTIDSPPSSKYYSVGQTGNTITWDWNDLDPSYYNITRDGFLLRENSWNSTDEDISINVDGLSSDDYIYRCTVKDNSDNTNCDEVLVSVSSSLLINGPDDFSYIYNEPNQEIEWMITSPNTANGYTIRRNETWLEENGVWSTGVPFSIDIAGLDVGLYKFNCTAKDEFEEITDIVWVTVEPDTNNPVLQSKTENMTINNEENIILNWTWSDFNPHKYIIKQEGVEVDFGDWNSGEKIGYSIGSLDSGIYEFECIVNDTFDNLNSSLIKLTIIEEQIILESSSEDSIYEVEDPEPHYIYWNWTTSNPLNYTIYQDETICIEQGYWVSGVPINITVSDLEIGSYNFTCWVNNTISAENQHSIIVDIVGELSPEAPQYAEFNKSFEDISLYGIVDKYVFWCQWTDYSDFSVKFNLNGTEYEVLEHEGNNYSISFTNLDVGEYLFNWTAEDEYININSSMLSQSFEIIIETVSPLCSLINATEQDNYLNISVQINDAHPSSGIQAVYLFYSEGEDSWDYVMMILCASVIINETTGENSYTYYFLVDLPSEVLYFYFEVYDNHNNFIKTETFEYGETDNKDDSKKENKVNDDLAFLNNQFLFIAGTVTLITIIGITLLFKRRKTRLLLI